MQPLRDARGVRLHAREDREYRAQPYMDWHRTLDRSLIMGDVDSVEWRRLDQLLIPVGVIELTRADAGVTLNAGYLAAIVTAYESPNAHAYCARYIAHKLGVKAWLCCFRYDCSEFMVYNLTNKRGWWHLTPEQYRTFLLSLRPDA